VPKKLFKQAKRFLPIIGIAIFLYLIYRLGFEKITDAILSIPPIYIILSISLTVPLVIIRNYEWQIIQREQKIKIGFWQSLKVLFIGNFYGSITPSYLGILMRVPYMKEKTREPYGKLFVNTVIDGVIHTFSLYVMMFIGALLLIRTIPIIFYITSVWIIVLAIVLIYFIKKERGEKLLYLLVKYFIPKKIKHHFHNFVSTFYTDFPRINRLILPLILGVLTWIIVFSQEYIIVLSLGLSIPYLSFLILFPIANVAGFVPITFAGLGTRELTSIFLFSTFFAVAEEKVFVFTVIGFVITDVLPGFIGFILSLTETKKRGKSLESIFN
jgi:glycosyltransferase 2 family protein